MSLDREQGAAVDGRASGAAPAAGVQGEGCRVGDSEVLEVRTEPDGSSLLGEGGRLVGEHAGPARAQSGEERAEERERSAQEGFPIQPVHIRYQEAYQAGKRVRNGGDEDGLTLV